MDPQASLLEQLEDVFASKDLARRAGILRKVTDLFVLSSGTFSEDQVALFDTVMGKLIENIESAARAQFGSRIARLPDAPPRVARVLASDTAIEVAGPLLTYCERLDQDTLVETARTRSQDHLLAISGRKVLVEAVTDVLVVRKQVRRFRNRAKRRRSVLGFRRFHAGPQGARRRGSRLVHLVPPGHSASEPRQIVRGCVGGGQEAACERGPKACRTDQIHGRQGHGRDPD